MSEHQKTLCFVGNVHDLGFHLATHSLATSLNVTTSSIIVIIIISIINPKPETLKS